MELLAAYCILHLICAVLAMAAWEFNPMFWNIWEFFLIGFYALLSGPWALVLVVFLNYEFRGRIAFNFGIGQTIVLYGLPDYRRY